MNLDKIFNSTDKELAGLKEQLKPKKQQFNYTKLYYPFCGHTLPMFDNFYTFKGEIITKKELPENYSTVKLERYNFPLPSKEYDIEFLEQFYTKKGNGTLTEREVLIVWIRLKELKAEDLPQLKAKGMHQNDINTLKDLFQKIK